MRTGPLPTWPRGGGGGKGRVGMWKGFTWPRMRGKGGWSLPTLLGEGRGGWSPVDRQTPVKILLPSYFVRGR